MTEFTVNCMRFKYVESNVGTTLQNAVIHSVPKPDCAIIYAAPINMSKNEAKIFTKGYLDGFKDGVMNVHLLKPDDPHRAYVKRCLSDKQTEASKAIENSKRRRLSPVEKRTNDLERQNSDLQANNTKLLLENRVLKTGLESAAIEGIKEQGYIKADK